MRDKHLVDIDSEPAEHQWARIGRGRALCVEVDFLSRQIRQRLDLRPNEDVQLGGEQTQDVGDALQDLRYLRFVFLERVTVDDGGVDAPEVQKIVDIFGGPA